MNKKFIVRLSAEERGICHAVVGRRLTVPHRECPRETEAALPQNQDLRGHYTSFNNGCNAAAALSCGNHDHSKAVIRRGRAGIILAPPGRAAVLTRG